jgi:hypothetical protein
MIKMATDAGTVDTKPGSDAGMLTGSGLSEG